MSRKPTQRFSWLGEQDITFLGPADVPGKGNCSSTASHPNRQTNLWSHPLLLEDRIAYVDTFCLILADAYPDRLVPSEQKKPVRDRRYNFKQLNLTAIDFLHVHIRSSAYGDAQFVTDERSTCSLVVIQHRYDL